MAWVWSTLKIDRNFFVKGKPHLKKVEHLLMEDSKFNWCPVCSVQLSSLKQAFSEGFKNQIFAWLKSLKSTFYYFLWFPGFLCSNLKKYHRWRECKILKKSLYEQAALWKIIETTGSRFTSSDSSKTKGKFFIDHIDNSVWFWFDYLLMRDPRTRMRLSSDGPLIPDDDDVIDHLFRIFHFLKMEKNMEIAFTWR